MTNPILLRKRLAVALLPLVTCLFLGACYSSPNPAVRGASYGGTAGVAGGLLYDQAKKDWSGKLDADSFKRGAVGGAVGAGTGAVIGSQSAPRY